MVRQRCSDGRMAGIRTRNARPRQVKIPLPPYAMQMRSKTGRKSRRMEPSSKANLRLTDDNAPPPEMVMVVKVRRLQEKAFLRRAPKSLEVFGIRLGVRGV